MNSIDKFIYINLKSRPDRNIEILNNLKKMNIPNEKIYRLDAVFNSLGAIGCYLSHIKVLEYAIRNNLKTIAVLEDDFNFIEDNNRVYKELEIFISTKKKWDALLLCRGGICELKEMEFQNFYKINYCSSTAGYLIHYTFYEKALKLFKEGLKLLEETKDLKNYPIDVYCWKILQPNNDFYMCYPSLGYQRSSFSDIEKRNTIYSTLDGSLYNNTRKYITCQIKGGLGNCLFQIATVLSLGWKYDLEQVFENVESSYSIFNNRPVYWNSVFSRCKLLDSNEYTKTFSDCYYVKEDNNGYSRIVCDTRHNYLLDGYFQNPKHFIEHKNILKSFFQFPILENKKNSVSIHIRRGDYLKLSHFHENLDINYYCNAISHFPKNSSFYILSDDIEWCKDKFFFCKNITYIDNLNDVESLAFMISCNYHIIANSSFSWWGSFLSDSNKTIYPENWYVDKIQNDINIKNMPLNNWICCPYKKDKISILIALYNGIEFLNECLDSVLNQSYSNFEILIGVNAPNTQERDKIYDECCKIIQKNDKIIIKKYDSVGKGNTLNSMVKDATSDIICILDCDDKWSKNKLEEQYNIYITKFYDVIGTWCEYFGEKSGSPDIPSLEISDFFTTNPIINSSVMLSKKLMLQFPYSDSKIEDYEMWLFMNNKGISFFNIPQKLVQIRIHKNSYFSGINNKYVVNLVNHFKNLNVFIDENNLPYTDIGGYIISK